jgi:hypothetical protein
LIDPLSLLSHLCRKYVFAFVFSLSMSFHDFTRMWVGVIFYVFDMIGDKYKPALHLIHVLILISVNSECYNKNITD